MQPSELWVIRITLLLMVKVTNGYLNAGLKGCMIT